MITICWYRNMHYRNASKWYWLPMGIKRHMRLLLKWYVCKYLTLHGSVFLLIFRDLIFGKYIAKSLEWFTFIVILQQFTASHLVRFFSPVYKHISNVENDDVIFRHLVSRARLRMSFTILPILQLNLFLRCSAFLRFLYHVN